MRKLEVHLRSCESVNIRRSSEGDFVGIMEVAKALHPDWFDKIAIGESIPRDIGICKGFVAEEGGRIVGFILSSSSSEKAEIKWIGVAPGFHRRGIGSELFLAAERELRSAGTEEIRVKTVAAETEYEPYEKSRAFYERMGFRVETVVKTRSGDTGEEFGMATYVKEI